MDIDRRETEGYVIKIIDSPNWKRGIPKIKGTPKWLLYVYNKRTFEDGCPDDEQLVKLNTELNEQKDDETRRVIYELGNKVEDYNSLNIRNPEKGRDKIWAMFNHHQMVL